MHSFGAEKLVETRVGAANLAASALRVVLISSAVFALWLFGPRLAQAQTEIVLYSFCQQHNCTDGDHPYASLTADGNGNFYGTTDYGGGGLGTVFELSPDGSGGWRESVLYSFCSVVGSACLDGDCPCTSNVVLDSVGNLYGTTAIGGAYGHGVIFELSPEAGVWSETVLYNFTGGGDGGNPRGGLVMDQAGNLYGSTASGGAGAPCAGTFFQLSPSSGTWTFKVIHQCATRHGGLAIDAHGSLFGVKINTVFKLSPLRHGGWRSAGIHVFNTPRDGRHPEGTPALDQAGNLYGTTYSGGAHGYGTVFRLSPGNKGKWTEKILYSFQGGDTDGGNPWAGVVLDAAGNIYGTTYSGGAYSFGTLFELMPEGGKGSYKEKVLWNFNRTDGFQSSSSLILDSAGNLYGTSYDGGPGDGGVVFEVTR